MIHAEARSDRCGGMEQAAGEDCEKTSGVKQDDAGEWLVFLRHFFLEHLDISKVASPKALEEARNGDRPASRAY